MSPPRPEAQAVPVADLNDVANLVAQYDDSWLSAAAHVEPDVARLARELKHDGHRHVGILPVDAVVPTPVVAARLGQALALLTQRVVLVLDPERRGYEGGSGSALEARLLAPGVASIAPPRVAEPGRKFEALKALAAFAERDAGLWGVALHDLSGCTRAGELLGAIDAIDAVVVVGQLGRTTESALRRAIATLPPAVTLGVLLVE